MGRIYLQGKETAFQKNMKELKATYLEDTGSAVFIMDTAFPWRKKILCGYNDDEWGTPGIRVDDDGTVVIGAIKKSCMNFTCCNPYYTKREIQWISKKLAEIHKVL